MSETDPEFVAAKLATLSVAQRVIEAVVESTSLTLRADAFTTAHLFWVAAHGLVSLQKGGCLVVGRTLDELSPVLFTALSIGMVEEASGMVEEESS